jgi:hypothetical protein
MYNNLSCVFVLLITQSTQSISLSVETHPKVLTAWNSWLQIKHTHTQKSLVDFESQQTISYFQVTFVLHFFFLA